MIKIFHNNRCSKSRCALAELENSGRDFEIINYLETLPTRVELIAILEKLELSPLALIRESESIFIRNYKGKTLSNDEWIDAMVENPILIERPIVISGDKAVIARPTEKINEILK